MKASLCAYKRGETYFTSYHWCNECPPADQYRSMEKEQKLAWTKANKERKQAWENKRFKKASNTQV
jgi:hypothetical protein